MREKGTSYIPVEAKYLASGGASTADGIVEDQKRKFLLDYRPCNV